MVKVKALNENIGDNNNKIGDIIDVPKDVVKMLLDNKIVAELPKEEPKQEPKKEGPKKEAPKKEDKQEVQEGGE